jgi:hypothetical protein
MVAALALTGAIVAGLATGPRAVLIVAGDWAAVLTVAFLVGAILTLVLYAVLRGLRRCASIRTGHEGARKRLARATVSGVGWLIGVPLAVEAWSAPTAWWFGLAGPVGAATAGVALGSLLLVPSGVGQEAVRERSPGGRSWRGLVLVGCLTALLSGVAGWVLADLWNEPSAWPAPPGGEVVEAKAGNAGDPASATPVPTHGRYLCILVDGISAAELAELARGFGAGHAVEMQAEPVKFSPTFWQTVLTGHGVFDHGMTGMAARRLLFQRGVLYAKPGNELGLLDVWETVRSWLPGPFGRHPPDPSAVGLKPIWQVASERGRTVGVVNAWFTWPAPRVRRFAVSDAVRRLLATSGAATPEPSANGLYWPENPEWARDVHAAVQEARGKPQVVNRGAVALMCAGMARFTPQPDLLVLQVDGPGGAAGLNISEPERRSYLQVLDGWLAPIRACVEGEDLSVFFMGWSRETPGATLWIHGPGANQKFVEHLTAVDVAPTILHGLGLPVSRELPGKVQPTLLPERARGIAPRWIDSYGRSSRPSLRLGPAAGSRQPVPDLPYLHPRR